MWLPRFASHLAEIVTSGARCACAPSVSENRHIAAERYLAKERRRDGGEQHPEYGVGI
jgi:hypothetical protein